MAEGTDARGDGNENLATPEELAQYRAGLKASADARFGALYEGAQENLHRLHDVVMTRHEYDVPELITHISRLETSVAFVLQDFGLISSVLDVLRSRDEPPQGDVR